MMKKNLQKQIERNWSKQLETLKNLLAIESVQGEEKPGKPFGEGVAQAYEYVLQQGAAYGFTTVDVDGYGGHIEYAGNSSEGEDSRKKQEILGIACHLDTVPVGEGWDHSPFGKDVVENRLFGRGTIDDKGPAVAALFAMIANQEVGHIPKKKVRLILGLDEETNWHGVDKYLEKEQSPDLGFTPDGVFPVIHGEKGILVFDLVKKMNVSSKEGFCLTKIEGGLAANMVPDQARAVIFAKDQTIYEKVREKAKEWKEQDKGTIHLKGMGKSLEIKAMGKAAHGARPDQGRNAISVIMAFLSEFSFSAEETNSFLDFFQKHIGYDYHGERINCAFEDRISGKTIFNVGKIHLDRGSATLTINMRIPISLDAPSVYQSLEEICGSYGMGILKHKYQPSIYIDSKDPLIATLMDVYREHTGDEQADPLVIGGGTYARAFPHMVAFGATFPDEESCAHQKNEYIDLDRLKKMTEIYAHAIYRLTQ